MQAALDAAVREAGGRITAALAARYRDLDLAEESFAEACARAAAGWDAPPRAPAAWLYRVAERCALDLMRKRSVRARVQPDPPEPEPTAEELMMDDGAIIPDERLRLIFVCCHPAVAPDTRAALTLRLVCGLSTPEIARAFLLPEPTLAQRLVRAKRKIAEAGVPFEVPGPGAWSERLGAVLTTLEIAYAKAHEDAAGTGEHAGYAAEMLGMTALLARLLPDEPEVQALAATVRFAEARRLARIDASGAMVPLAEQDPQRWDAGLIEDGDACLVRSLTLAEPGVRALQAAIHGAWCARKTRTDAAPWSAVLGLYDRLLALADSDVLRLNRAVALAEVEGPGAALREVERLSHAGLRHFQPFHAVRADLLRRLGRSGEAREAYDAALALAPGEAERLWLERRRAELISLPPPG